MSATDPTARLQAIGVVLAQRTPGVLVATTALLESVFEVVDLHIVNERDAARPVRYEILHPIATGGHAEVLLGVARGAEGFHRPVAIKRLRADLTDPGRFVTMLAEEAHHAARLSHPNVVSVLDLDLDTGGRPYLVMEHVDGIDLTALFETGPVPYPVAIFVVRELLSGLGYIHQARGRGHVRGLVHRDVKPRNVLLSWAGEVKLADFGLAQVIEGTRTVGVNAFLGTPGYMSPEQTYREDLDGRSDLYAVGIILWELLAHERLRVGTQRDVTATAIFEAIPRPSKYRQVPADLEAVAMRLLARDRDERYPTAELAVRDLMRCRDVSRDGRGHLVRLLDERFPRSQRRDPLSLSLGLSASSSSSFTAAASPPPEPLPLRWPTGPWDSQIQASLWARLWLWFQLLACGLLFVAALAATIAFFVMR